MKQFQTKASMLGYLAKALQYTVKAYDCVDHTQHRGQNQAILDIVQAIHKAIMESGT